MSISETIVVTILVTTFVIIGIEYILYKWSINKSKKQLQNMKISSEREKDDKEKENNNRIDNNTNYYID